MPPPRRGGRGRKPKKSPKLEMITYLDSQDSETVCGVCLAEFIDPDDLKVHIAQVHRTSTATEHRCNFCSTTLPSLDLYLVHLRDQHFASMKCCMYCSRGFIDIQKLREHEAKHISQKKDMYSCSQCKVLFSNIQALETHEVSSHSSSKEGVILQNHYPLLSTLLGVKADTFIQSLGQETVYICVKCKFTTPELRVYLNHTKKQKCKVFACDKCSSVYGFKLGLIHHLNYHQECHQDFDATKHEKKCKECKQLFSIQTYRTHIKKCKAIKCVSCDMIFETVGQLSQHQSAEHPLSVMLKTCRYCNQELVGSANLFKHMERLHKKDYHQYKYNCVYCGCIFKHPKKLLGHLFSKHRDLKPFSCKICNQEFRLRKSFTIHIKMKHASQGFVEFDEKMNVFFTDTKSVKPYQPPENPSLYNEEEAKERPFEPAETECETDFNTDIEKTTKKTLKKNTANARKKALIKNEDTDLNTDIASETDANLVTEADTDKEDTKKKMFTRKRKTFIKEVIHPEDEVSDESSDNEPLLKVRKRVKSNRTQERHDVSLNRKKTKLSMDKRRLTCNICKKYCYTIQNYHRHVSMHFKHESKQCIKCAKLFSTKEELETHMKTDHATTHITETLKKLLEKRKMVIKGINDTLPTSQKFERTIIKVAIPKFTSTARLVPTKGKSLSVKNFLESFTPEITDAKKYVSVDSVVTIREVHKPDRQPKIKMTKFREEPSIITSSKCKIQLPKKFNRLYSENVKATLKVHQGPYQQRSNLNFGHHVTHIDNVDEQEDTKNFDFYEDAYQDDNYAENEYVNNDTETIIPDVAEEVMLDNTREEQPNQKQVTTSIPHKLVIPQTKHKIQIAHLQAQAPFFKIVPFEEIMKNSKNTGNDEIDIDENDIKLPSGTKLVNANPLAHLLGNKTVEELKIEEKGKYYKYKPRLDAKAALAKALLNLDKPTPPAKRKPKPKTIMLKPTPSSSKRRKNEQ